MALNENPTLEEIVNEVERLNNLIVSRGGSQTITPKTTNQVLNKGYYKGDITIKGDANLIANNILSGKSIFGVSGNVTVSSLGGKKWASGTASELANSNLKYIQSHATALNTIGSYKYIEVSNLEFKPSQIIVYVDDATLANTIPYYHALFNSLRIGEGNVMTAMFYVNNAGSEVRYKINEGDFYVNNTGFRLLTGVSTGKMLNWIAFE